MTQESTQTRAPIRRGKNARKTPLVIREVALRMFSTDGYEGTSMRQIAAAVGVNAASLYNHYPSKQSILAAICNETMRELLDGQQAAMPAPPTSPDEALRQLGDFVRMHTMYHIENALSCRIINQQLASLVEPDRTAAFEMRDLYEHRLRELIHQGIDLGVFTAQDVRLASYAILAMGMHLSVWYNDTGRLAPEEIVRGHEILALQVLGICTNGPDPDP